MKGEYTMDKLAEAMEVRGFLINRKHETIYFSQAIQGTNWI